LQTNPTVSFLIYSIGDSMIHYIDINTGNNLLDEALENYLMRGFQPGGFLTAVLANDLFMAVGRGDHWNRTNLDRIVNEVVHKMPSIAWGSYAAVKDWCKDVDSRRSYYAERVKQEYTMRVLRDEHKRKIDSNSFPF
jgi:hypothetical protein